MPDNRSHKPLYRLDLFPFSAHQNGPTGPKHLTNLFIDAGVSHEHSYLPYDFAGDWELPKIGDPLASVFPAAPKNFDEAMDYVCATLNITNRKDVPPVPGQMELI